MVLDTLVSNLGIVNLTALLAIVVIGLPHGAADPVRPPWLYQPILERVQFFSAYSIPSRPGRPILWWHFQR